MQSWPLELEAKNWKEIWDLCISVIILTRKKCAGYWPWAARGTPWWRSPHWCHSSESLGIGECTAGPHQTPWGRTPARTRTSTRNSPPVHPSRVVTVTDMCCRSFHLEGSRAFTSQNRFSSINAGGDLEINTKSWNLTFPEITFNSGSYVHTSVAYCAAKRTPVLTKSENG